MLTAVLILNFLILCIPCDLWSYAKDPDGDCMVEVTYNCAIRYSESYGARVCTMEENEANCSKASRCGLNTKQIWGFSDIILPTFESSSVLSQLPNVTASVAPSVTASIG